MSQISAHADHDRRHYRFERCRSDRLYVPLEKSDPIKSYLTEIARLLGIVAAGCCLLVVMLVLHP